MVPGENGCIKQGTQKPSSWIESANLYEAEVQPTTAQWWHATVHRVQLIASFISSGRYAGYCQNLWGFAESIRIPNPLLPIWSLSTQRWRRVIPYTISHKSILSLQCSTSSLRIKSVTWSSIFRSELEDFNKAFYLGIWIRIRIWSPIS